MITDEEVPKGFPTFSLQPNMQGVEKGRNALIPCRVTGDPEPTITWLKDMMPIDMSKPRYSMYQGASLQILSAQEEDQGQYECVASNGAGTAYSELATLFVRSKFVSLLFLKFYLIVSFFSSNRRPLLLNSTRESVRSDARK